MHKEQELNASVELSERFSQACEKQSSSGTVQIQKHIAAETEVALVIWTSKEQHPQIKDLLQIGSSQNHEVILQNHEVILQE